MLINKQEARLRSGWRIFVFFIASAVIVSVLSILFLNQLDGVWESPLNNLTGCLVILLTTYFTAKYIDRRPCAGFGLLPIKWTETGIGFLSAALMIGLIIAVLYSFSYVQISQLMHVKSSEATFAYVFAVQMVRYASGSIMEEVFSRGFLMKNLAEGFNGALVSETAAVLLAALLSASIFGVLHVFNPGATILSTVNLILIGILFTVPVLFTGRLWFSIGLHAGWNITQNNIFGMPNSGKATEVSWMMLRTEGSDWMTGGSYGIEGGLVCTCVTIIAIGLMLVLYRRRGMAVIYTAAYKKR